MNLGLPHKPPHLEIILQYVDWNGQNCGYEHQHERIVKFSEPRNISTLEVVPLDFLNEKSQVDIRTNLQSRGRKFQQLRGYHFKTSNGKRVVLERNSITGEDELIHKPVCAPFTM